MQCTCCQLVLVPKCLVAPWHRIEALQLVGMPVNQEYFKPSAKVSNCPFLIELHNVGSHLCTPTQRKKKRITERNRRKWLFFPKQYLGLAILLFLDRGFDSSHHQIMLQKVPASLWQPHPRNCNHIHLLNTNA